MFKKDIVFHDVPLNITCKKCFTKYSINEIKIQNICEYERFYGYETEVSYSHIIKCECDKKISIELDVWYYPEDTFNYIDINLEHIINNNNEITNILNSKLNKINDM